MSRTILVTGAAGFIGRHVSRALAARGDHVIAVDRRPMTELENVQCRVMDLLDRAGVKSLLASVRPDAVLHLAARTDLQERRDLAGYRDNIEAVENLVDALSGSAVGRWVCTSSQLVCRVGYTPAHDQDYAPDNLYGASKVRTEQICRGRDGGGVPWTIVRPTTIWGPGMNPHYMRLFNMIRRGWYVHVGRGPTFKSYGFVGNTVAQYLALLDVPIAQVERKMFFLADYVPIAIERWVDAFARELGARRVRTIPVAVARTVALLGDALTVVKPGFPFTSFRLRNVLTAYQADTRATAAICPDLPYDMEAGVRLTVDWLREVWSETAA